VSEGVVGEGGTRCCSLILHRLVLVASCCSLLACLVSLVSRVSCVRESFISSSLWLEQFGAWSISLSFCEREIEEGEMGRGCLDRDARIKLSIGTKYRGFYDDPFFSPQGLVFDHHRGLLLVVDGWNHRVHLFSCDDDGGGGGGGAAAAATAAAAAAAAADDDDDDGAAAAADDDDYDDYDALFVSKFGEEGYQPGQLLDPYGIALDHDHDRILITDSGNHRVQSWSLSEQSFLSCIGEEGSGDLEFNEPQGIAIDKHHRRIIIVDSYNDRLVFLSSIDLSFLFEIGKQGSRPGEFDCPSSIAIDDDRHRIIVTDSNNHRVQVLSLIDGSFLFEFGSKGDQPCQLNDPRGVCIANQGGIIVADTNNNRLQSFTHEGHHISSFDCGIEKPWAVAFDEHRGLIAFSAGERVHVIGANQWLADTKFTWRPDLHRYAPSWMKRTVSTMTMIRSLVDESAMSMIPNELLFEIFSFL